MRIAFLANRFLDPRNPRSWSGLPFYIQRALEDAGVQTLILALNEAGQIRGWSRFLYWKLRHGKRYLRSCEERLLQNYARQAERQLPALEVDALFSPSTWLLAHLETDLPIILWTDACFAGLLNFYQSFSNLAPPSIDAGHAAEQRALSRCSQAVYSTQWALDTVRDRYRIDPSRLSLVPFGGNILEPPSLEQVTESINKRDSSECRLLFVGVEWQRKGADIAVETLVSLKARGHRAHLTIVGCKAPGSVRLPSDVEVIPFIGKETIHGRRRLNALYQSSHFFIMPSRAEAFGVVFAEASAFGLPCLAADVGGLASVITEDVNGRLFSPATRGSEYADYIISVMQNPGTYRRFALRAAGEGAGRLSWKEAGKEMAELLEQTVAPKKSIKRPADTLAR